MSTLVDLTERMLLGNLDVPLIVVMRPNIQNFDKSSRKLNSQQLTNSGWVDFHWGNDRDIINCRGMSAGKMGNRHQYKKSDYLLSNLKSTTKAFDLKNGVHDSLGTHSYHGPEQWAEIDRAMMKIEQIYKLDKEPIGSISEILSSNYITAAPAAAILKSFGLEDAKTNRTQLLEQIRNKTAKRARSFIIFQYCIYWGYFVSFHWNREANTSRNYTYDFQFKVTDSSVDWLSKSLLTNFPEARALNLFTQIKDAAEYSASMVANVDKMIKQIFI